MSEKLKHKMCCGLLMMYKRMVRNGYSDDSLHQDYLKHRVESEYPDFKFKEWEIVPEVDGSVYICEK